MSERRFTRPASSIRSTARKSARPRPMTTSGSGPTRSVHCGGTDHTVAPSSCSKRRSPYRLYRLPIQVSRRPNNGWNGCVTRTNCSDGLEKFAFSVEIQTAGARKIFVAIGCRRGGDDLDGTDELSSVRNRLAPSPRKLASDECRMRVLGLKELANVIYSLYAIEACRPPFGSCRRPRDDHGGAGCTGEGRSPCDGCLQ